MAPSSSGGVNGNTRDALQRLEVVGRELGGSTEKLALVIHLPESIQQALDSSVASDRRLVSWSCLRSDSSLD